MSVVLTSGRPEIGGEAGRRAQASTDFSSLPYKNSNGGHYTRGDSVQYDAWAKLLPGSSWGWDKMYSSMKKVRRRTRLCFSSPSQPQVDASSSPRVSPRVSTLLPRLRLPLELRTKQISMA